MSDNSKDNNISDKTKAADETTNPNDAKTAANGSSKAISEDKTEDANSEVTKDCPSEITPGEQLMAQILEMLQQVKQVVMDTLKLTPDELNQLMEQYSAKYGEINIADLLKPDTLKQLALLNSGKTDLMSALTDEKLSDSMNQLLDAVGQIKNESNLPFTDEQIKLVLDQLGTNDPVTGPVVQATNVAVQGTAQQASVKDDKTAAVNKEQVETEASLPKDGEKGITKLSVSNENSPGAKADSDKHDSQKFDTSDQFQAFVDKLVQVSQTAKPDSSDNMIQITELREIASQIIDRIKVTVNPGNTSMELQLNPEELGKVNLTIQSKNGAMTAQFVVQNEISKEAIESQMNTLRETLSQQGIKVDSIEVTVAAYAFEQNSQSGQESQSEGKKDQSGRKITLEEAFAMNELPEEEIVTPVTDGLTGSQIDYTA
jgi:flagellar hook-length control protein FliK